LDLDVENQAVLIDGAPRQVLLAGDRAADLIDMPWIGASRRAGRRFASISSAMRTLNGNPKASQTA
jgi:hypothetical protein